MAGTSKRVVITNEADDAKVTVLDYTNANPLAVRLTDTGGDYVGAGAGTEYTEDAASPADPVGKAIVVTRDDQLSTVTEAAGDWSRLRGTSKGALWVALADASGDPITSFGGGTQYAVNAALGATPTGTLSIAIRDDALSALTPVEGDAIGLRVDGEGALWVIPSGTVTVDGSGVTQPVSGTFYQATQPVSIAGTVTVDLAGNNDVGINAGTNLIGDTTIRGNTVADGSGSDVWALIDAAGHLQIDVISAPSTAVTGTFWQATQPISGTVTANLGATDNGVLDQIELNTDPLLVVGGGAEATAQRVTIANDSTGVVSIDDNAGSLTVDNKSIDGAGAPTIDSYTHVAINLTTGADQVLVSSAASKQIWVYGYGFTCGDADGQTVSLQDESDTALTGIMEFAQYGGISVSPSGNFAMPVLKLGTDKDLEVDITGGDVDGWLDYAIVSV